NTGGAFSLMPRTSHFGQCCFNETGPSIISLTMIAVLRDSGVAKMRLTDRLSRVLTEPESELTGISEERRRIIGASSPESPAEVRRLTLLFGTGAIGWYPPLSLRSLGLRDGRRPASDERNLCMVLRSHGVRNARMIAS